MKLKLIALSLISAFSFSTTYAVTNDMSNSQKSSDDNEIIAWLITLNKNEISAAKEVFKKPVNAPVKAYANMMNKDHSKNLRETMMISRKIGEKPVDDQTVDALKQKGKEELATLKPLKKDAFQTAYINAMVDGHAQALQAIDNGMMQKVSNDRLKQHLQMTRTHIQHHLELAKEIQNKLNSQS